MWKLMYEDTFGFGEDRDPPKIENTGSSRPDGFFQLWTKVLDEGLTISQGKPAAGFANFTLLIDLPNEKSKSVSIDVRKYIDSLSELKQEANLNKIQKISAEHYEACLKSEEESFWNNFSRQKNPFKVFAVNIGKKDYTKKIISTVLMIAFANALFLFCLVSMFYLLSIQKTTESIIAGVFALIFLSINIVFFNIKRLSLRYRNPEKFYIEIDDTHFIHSDGNFVKKIDRNSIRKISEEEIISRGGFHAMIIVEYADNDTIKTYSFYKAFSRRNIVYDIPASKLDAHVK